MISYESRKVRHVVARLERGDDLHEALRTLAEDHQVSAAWISALGAFESVELCEYDQEGQRYRPAKRIETPVEIINLTGNISFKDGAPFAHVHATVSREKGDAIEVLGGHVVDARVFACELRLDVYDDLVLGRSHDAATGLALWGETGGPSPAVTPEASGTAPAPSDAPGSGGVSWAQVAQASASDDAAPTAAAPAPEAPPPERLSLAERRRRAKARQAEKKKQRALDRSAPPARAPEPLPEKRRMTEDEFFEEPIPEKGDYVKHRVFGLCAVEGESETGGIIIRLDTGVRKAIKLEIFDVRPPQEDAEGRLVFELVPRRRK